MTYRLNGTWIGTPGSWANAGDTGDKSYDGNTSTYFDAPNDAAWTGQDYGAGQAKRITAFRFYPRSGWAFRMTGGVFEAANQPDFSDAVNLCTVMSDPIDGIYTTIPVTRPEKFRYFRFSSNGHGNVAEVQVYGYEAPAAPAGLTVGLAQGGASLSWSAAAWAAGYRVESAPTADGPFTSLGDFTGGTTLADPSVPAGRRPFYRVSAINPAGLSAPSAVVQAVPSTPFYAWQLDRFGDQSASTQAGAEWDPDRDGMANLLEYAFGADPQTVDRVMLTPEVGEERVSVTYPQNPAASDITLKAEWSDDLVNWSGEGVSYEVASGDGEPLRMRAGVAKGATQRFMRLVAAGL
jgi:hypothetical protein